MQNLFKNREMLLGLIIIGMILSFTTRAPNFASPENLANIFNDTSILIILALGQMVVILTKSIDLSVAANLAFTGMAVAMLDSAYPGLPLALLVFVAIGIGAARGILRHHPGNRARHDGGGQQFIGDRFADLFKIPIHQTSFTASLGLVSTQS